MGYNLEEVITSRSIYAILIASISLIILTAISLSIKHPSSLLKKVLFLLICLVVVAATLFISVSTIYLNLVSLSKGPVHYHADLEIWACGKQLDLINPRGLSNKVGTPTLHEHNDKRIHLEGVVVKGNDASLGRFMEIIGGFISKGYLVVPTNQGKLTFKSGENSCPGSTQAFIQTFVYKVSGKNYTQEKIDNPAGYIISPHSQVPPGDCIIIEYDSLKEKTDKICRSFQVAKEIGKLTE